MNRIHCVLASTLALSVAAFGCSKQSESTTPSGAAVGAERSETFRYAPQDRSFRQTTVDTKTISAPGTSLSSEMSGQYSWDISTRRQGDTTTYSAQLTRVVLSINGQNAVNQAPAANEIRAQVDPNGRVIGLSGADTLATGLVGRLAPEQQAGARARINEAVRDTVAERFQLTVADLQGRPTALGSSWTVNSAAGQPVRSKTWKVQGVEVCGTAQCMRVNSTYDIDSEAITAQLQGELAATESGAPRNVMLRDVDVKAQDSILVEPNTLFLHAARFEQTARVILDEGGRRTPMVITQVRDLKTSSR